MYGLAGELMFTGLVEQKGQIISNVSVGLANRLIISSSYDHLETGESIAVNGVCLTLLPCKKLGQLSFDISPETLELTTLGLLDKDEFVNLERAMVASARFGGHYVSGHVDTKVQVESITPIDDYIQLSLFGFTQKAALYLLPKGSITVEGVSLTINKVVNQTIKLMLVPHTLSQTTLGALKVGQYVNIEFDYFTRIIAHQLQLFEKLDCEVES